MLNLTERVRSSPYYPALVHPVFRRVLPGAAASALGDGMSAVAIAWLALKLAPAGSRGLWVGAAVAAYTLPGAVGAIALRRWLSGRHGTGLVIVNAVLRAVALGLVGCLALAGVLDLPGYVALLGASSLLTAWGVAGKYTLIADLFPAEQRVAGEHRVQPGRPAEPDDRPGPGRRGDRAGRPGHRHHPGRRELGAPRGQLRQRRPLPRAPSRPSRHHLRLTGPRGGWALIRSVPVLGGLLALSFVFYLLYGPLEVALPVHVATDLHGSAALLGVYWAVFGVGAIIGELSAPFLRRWPVWPVMTGIVLGWGVALLPLGLPGPLWVGLAAFFAGGVICGPWMSLSMGVFQDASPPGALARVLAARGSLLILASPIGTAFGGPLVSAFGARGTLLVSALATIALGLITTAVLARSRTVRSRTAQPRPTGSTRRQPP